MKNLNEPMTIHARPVKKLMVPQYHISFECPDCHGAHNLDLLCEEEEYTCIFCGRKIIIKVIPMMKGSDPNLFECEEGWHPLILETLKKIQDISDEKGLDIEVSQVKEKYGGLRIYLTGYTPEIERIIQEAEGKSLTICEVCGKSGSFRSNMDGWYLTRCDKCFHDGLFELEEKILKGESK